MFQFPPFASGITGLHTFSMQGFPIRTSTDLYSFAAPRSFSQLTTSFVASESLGIHHALLFASYSYRLLFLTFLLFRSSLSRLPALSMIVSQLLF